MQARDEKLTTGRRLAVTALTVAAGLALTGCGSAGDSGGDDASGAPDDGSSAAAQAEPTTVQFAIGGGVSPATAPASALPIALGYWEDEGLDVEVLTVGGSGETIQAIDAGQADAGKASPSTLMAATDAGSDQLVAYYTYMTTTYLQAAVPADSDIQSAADLSGRTLGVHSLESGTIPYVRAMLEDEGADPDSVEFAVVGTGAEAAEFLSRGDVDGLALWDTGHFSIESISGIDLREITTEESLTRGFDDALISTRSNLESMPDELVGIARGIAKATVFARENPEAAVRITWENYPESKPTGVSEEEALTIALQELDIRLSTMEPAGLWGETNDETVQGHIDMLLNAGFIDNEIAPSEVFTDELLEQINDFDEEAVKQQARDWTSSS